MRLLVLKEFMVQGLGFGVWGFGVFGVALQVYLDPNSL